MYVVYIVNIYIYMMQKFLLLYNVINNIMYKFWYSINKTFALLKPVPSARSLFLLYSLCRSLRFGLIIISRIRLVNLDYFRFVFFL